MTHALVLSSILFLMGMSACHESKIENSKPSSIDSERKEKAGGSADAAVDERVDPPAPIAGVYLKASSVEESMQNGRGMALIGIASHYNGIRIADQRSRFMVTMSASPNGNNSVRIVQEEVTTGDYDQRIIIDGQNLDQIRNAYADITLYVTIFDRSDNTSDSLSIGLQTVLDAGTMKRSVRSSQSTSKPSSP